MLNPLLEKFRDEGHGWAASLITLLEDFERRLQELGSDPPEPGNGGNGGGEAESGTESANRSVPE